MVSLLITFCCTSSITKSPTIVSCLHNPNNNNIKKNGSAPSSLSPPSKQRKQQERTTSTPSVAEIERVIGAGVFRDRDTDSYCSDSEGSKTLFDTILSNSIGKKEGSVEKKLRETGEWILNKTETSSSSSSAGKQILQTVFLLILPMWILSFLVAFGIIQLPFHSPVLEDWIM